MAVHGGQFGLAIAIMGGIFLLYQAVASKIHSSSKKFARKEDLLRLEDEIDTIRKDIHIKIDEIKKSTDGLTDSIKELTNRYHEIDKNLAVVAKK
tara:strand:- start:571 stop:855 length:285 start_codon:yes stop_codon:yes gene_type:complete